MLVLASCLTRFKFVAKSELANVPIFGAGARAAGTIFVERGNRKSAFEAYREAAVRIHEGASVVVFPEGTRNTSYQIRPFKKGPFVLAVEAQAPLVPVVIHGTREIQPKGRIRVKPGIVNVHFLEPVPTAGTTIEDRDRLAVTVRNRMVEFMKSEYGVESPPWDPRKNGS